MFCSFWVFIFPSVRQILGQIIIQSLLSRVFASIQLVDSLNLGWFLFSHKHNLVIKTSVSKGTYQKLIQLYGKTGQVKLLLYIRRVFSIEKL